MATETLDLGRFLSIRFSGTSAELCVTGEPVATFADADKARDFGEFITATFDALAARRPTAAAPTPADFFTMDRVAAFAGFRPLPNDF